MTIFSSNLADPNFRLDKIHSTEGYLLLNSRNYCILIIGSSTFIDTYKAHTR